MQPISSNTRSNQPIKTVRFSPSVGVAKIPITLMYKSKTMCSVCAAVCHVYFIGCTSVLCVGVVYISSIYML